MNKEKKIPHLKTCPPAGEGNHAFVFYAACVLIEAGFTDEEAIPIIRERMSREPEPSHEIEDALGAARREDREPATKWPPRDFKTVEKVLAGPKWSPICPNAVNAPQTAQVKKQSKHVK
jgi:hypothetical protein